MKQIIFIILLCTTFLHGVQTHSLFQNATDIQKYIIRYGYENPEFIPLKQAIRMHAVKPGFIKFRGRNIKVLEKKGIREFMYNVLFYILEDYFIQTKQYQYRHIPIPVHINFENKRHYKQFIEGKEEGHHMQSPRLFEYPLEFQVVMRAYKKLGISFHDIDSNLNEGLHNIILEIFYNRAYGSPHLNPKWYLIDYDEYNINLFIPEFVEFHNTNKTVLKEILGERYKLYVILIDYFINGTLNKLDFIIEFSQLTQSYNLNMFKIYSQQQVDRLLRESKRGLQRVKRRCLRIQNKSWRNRTSQSVNIPRLNLNTVKRTQPNLPNLRGCNKFSYAK